VGTLWPPFGILPAGRSIARFRNNNLETCEGGGRDLLGEQIGESKGKRLVRRILSVEPASAELSFEDSGHA